MVDGIRHRLRQPVRFDCVNRVKRSASAQAAFAMSPTSMMSGSTQTSSLLRLPFEIRLMIYEYLLLPSKTPCSGRATSVANLIPDFHTYYSKDTNDDPFTLSVRTIDPWLGGQSLKTWRKRSTYHVRTGKSDSPTARLCCGSLKRTAMNPDTSQ